MRVLPLVQIIAIVFCGLMTGILLGDRMGPTYARPLLTPADFVTLQQVTHVHYSKVMPKLMAGAILCGVLWLVLIRAERRSIHFWLLVLSLAAVAAAAAVTIHVNFPINDQLMTWRAEAPPDDLRQIWSAWEKAHSVRTMLWVWAFVCEVAALAVQASRKA